MSSYNQDLPPVPPRDAPAEPLWSVGTIVAVGTALLAVLVSFGLPVDDDQQAKLLGLLLVAAPLVVAGIGRLKVWSPKTVNRIVTAERAKAAGR